ncbi:hypothetical protein vseg_013911 [Gypsophila vaccaria]
MSTRSSFHVCMDSSEWLNQESMSLLEVSTGLDSALSPPKEGGLLPPLMVERRLRPPHDQNLKCPRCDSTYTKFCYYNNYNLSQPRYFCKACRRYWTKGGSLRNVPVGGGCRKNKKSSTSSKKSNTDQPHPGLSQGGGCPGVGVGSAVGLMASSTNPNELHLSFPHMQFPPHLVDFIGAQMSLGGVNFMENSSLFRPIDFMGCKNDIGSHEFGVVGGMIGDHNVDGNDNGGYNGLFSTFGGIDLCSSNITSPYGHDGNSGINFVDQRLFLPFDENVTNNGHNNRHENVADGKPSNPKHLSLIEWEDQGYNVNDTHSSWSV